MMSEKHKTGQNHFKVVRKCISTKTHSHTGLVLPILHDLSVFHIVFCLKFKLGSGFHNSIKRKYPRDTDVPGLGPSQTSKAAVVQADTFANMNTNLSLGLETNRLPAFEKVQTETKIFFHFNIV